MKALVIPTSIDEKLRLIDIGKHPLCTFYREIDCNVIDYVTLDTDTNGISIDAVVDDEGMLNGSRVNQRFFISYLERLIPQPLFGTIIVVMTNEETGETTKFDLARVKDTLVRNFGFMESDFSKENLNENV